MNININVEPKDLAESYVDAMMHDTDANESIADFVMMIDRQVADMEFTMSLMRRLIKSVSGDGQEWLDEIIEMVKKESP